MQSNIPNLPHITSTNPSQTFQSLQKIIEQASTQPPTRPNKTTPTPTQNHSVTHSTLATVLQSTISSITKKQKQKFIPLAKQFSSYLFQARHVYIQADYLVDVFEDMKLVICKNNKVFQLGKVGAQVRGFVVVGKVVSVYKRKKKQQEGIESKQQRQEFCNLVQQGITRLVQDGKYLLAKNEKNYQLQDILLHHDMPDSTVDQVYLGNQVYNQFVSIQKSIILILPYKLLKPQCFNFIKSSLLHVFLDDASMLSKCITKQMFYKNSILKGLYFIDQGEVQVKSGRIIARGWTTYGKCKTSGFGWKFRPVPFIRFLVKNVSVWKQFFNDIELNDQYPFNIIHILGLNDDEDFTSSAQWRSLGKKKIGGGTKSPKLPKLNIGSKSVDQSKYQQIQRMRHYDQRINDIFTYKQDLLTRKLKGIIHNRFQPIFKNDQSQKKMDRQKNMILYRMNSKGSAFSKREIQTQPTQNILIMSVLKRLESIADMNQTSRGRQYSITQETSNYESNHNSSNSNIIKMKRQNTKLLPMQNYQRHRMVNRSKRY